MASKKVILLFIITMAVAHFPVFAEVAVPEPEASPVLEQHQKCSSNQECILIQRKCSDCDCGTPVNLKYSQTYREEKKLRCENYKGPVCDLMCTSIQSVCMAGKCTTK